MRGKNKAPLHRAPTYGVEGGEAHEYQLTPDGAEYVRLLNLGTYAMKAAVNLNSIIPQDDEVETARKTALEALEALRSAATRRVASADLQRGGRNHGKVSR